MSISNEVLLFSGGIDSFVAYHYLKHPQCVYFDTKNRYSKKEVKVIKELIPSTIIDHSLNFKKIERKNANIPYRNLFLAMMASARYADTVWIAGLKDDKVSDKTEEAFMKFSDLLSELEGKSIHVRSPFWNMTKVEVVSWYLNQGLPVVDLLKTISCYSEEPGNYCGKCASCFRKFIALRYNGIEIDFYNDELMLDYKDRCEQRQYDDGRCFTTLEVINDYRNRH